MREYKLKTGKLGEKIVGAYKTVEEKFADTFLEEDGSLKTGGMAQKVTNVYQKIEDTVVNGYQRIEDTVVGGYQKIEDAFVEKHLNKPEESAGDSKSGKR